MHKGVLYHSLSIFGERKTSNKFPHVIVLTEVSNPSFVFKKRKSGSVICRKHNHSELDVQHLQYVEDSTKTYKL